MSTLYGIEIVENSLMPATQPVLKLRDDCPVTDSFRTEMNKWLLDMFGENYVTYVFGGKIVANPYVVGIIKQQTYAHNLYGATT